MAVRASNKVVLVTLPAPGDNPIPQRLSLVDEVREILREGIRDGRWREYLPGERKLCAGLRVSRPTVKQAVEALAAEGWVTNQGRFRRKILRQPEAPKQKSKAVVLLAPVPLERFEPHMLLRVAYLRFALAGDGMVLSVVHGSRYFSHQPEAALADLVRERNAAVWLLSRSTEPMQTWFHQRGLPVIIMGTAFPGIDLCALEYEVAAVCRHAVGQFALRGHKRIGFLISHSQSAGDLASEEAFRQECSAGGRNIAPVVLHHDGTNIGICNILDRALRTTELPQAMLVSHAGACVTMVSHLALRRKHVGRDYGYISREDDPVLEFLVPPVARYHYEAGVYARRILEFVTKLSQGRRITKRHLHLMPNFIDGASMECEGFAKPALGSK